VKYLQRTETQPLELARKRFPRPELGELMELLPSALSFLFVRDPFERILSAYRNKLEGNKNTFYKALGTKIVHRYRKRSLGGPWPRCGPTFEEFVRFLIAEHAAGKRFDEHWAPVYSFCTPCSVNFTIIGKTETFQRDSEFIIRQAGLESLLLATGAGKGHHWGQCQCRELIPAGCSSSSAGQHPESRLRVLRGATQPNGAGIAKEE